MPVVEIPTIGDDPADRVPFRLVLDQRCDEIDLVHRDQLEDFAADVSLRVAWQGSDDLQMFRPIAAEEVGSSASIMLTSDLVFQPTE